MFRTRNHRSLIRSLAYICALPTLDTASLARYQERLSDLDLREGLRWSLVSERAMAMDSFFCDARIWANAWPVVLRTRHKYLDMMDELILPADADWEDLRHSVERLPEAQQYSPLLNNFYSAALDHSRSTLRTENLRRLAIAGLAARRFIEEQNRPPLAWEDLVPAYLADVPTSVTTGQAARIDPANHGDFVLAFDRAPAEQPGPEADAEKAEFRFSTLPISLEKNW